MSKILKQGGPHNVRHLPGGDVQMSISVPADQDGRVARLCVVDDCSPGYFKVKLGTGLTDQEAAYCPYCRNSAPPGEFVTPEQKRYAIDIATEELMAGANRMFKDALGLGANGRRTFGGSFLKIEMSMKNAPRRHVRRPIEDILRRDVTCPHCALDQTVYGLATWCADCGADIFLTHVASELAVTDLMLSDASSREERLGVRVAGKDIENCLEDAVSLFEAAMKALFRRAGIAAGRSQDEVEASLKRVGNMFQSPRRTDDFLLDQFGFRLFDALSSDEASAFSRTFEKRHPITHNLGVVDRKYLERTQSVEREGHEVLVTVDEICDAGKAVLSTLGCIHKRLFPEDEIGESDGDGASSLDSDGDS